jgi:hypothetical protein
MAYHLSVHRQSSATEFIALFERKEHQGVLEESRHHLIRDHTFLMIRKRIILDNNVAVFYAPILSIFFILLVAVYFFSTCKLIFH